MKKLDWHYRSDDYDNKVCCMKCGKYLGVETIAGVEYEAEWCVIDGFEDETYCDDCVGEVTDEYNIINGFGSDNYYSEFDDEFWAGFRKAHERYEMERYNA